MKDTVTKVFTAISFAIVILFFIFMPRDKNITITGKTWEYNIAVENYVQVSDSDWRLPPDAELMYTRNEIHHYDQVIDHYETVRRTYVDTEYVNGEYRDVTRTEEHREPVYTDEPVYRTKYYFKEWRWVHCRDIRTSGNDKVEPHYGEVELKDNERTGKETEKYKVKCFIGKDDGKTKEYDIDKESWFKIALGDKLEAKVQMNKIIEIK